jgi:choline dehydrogenase
VQTDDEWLEYCREMGETVFHPTSTCSIGKVVDEKLKVMGVENLRVIDASVIPAVPSGNINAAVIALAEKAADIIKADVAR